MPAKPTSTTTVTIAGKQKTTPWEKKLEQRRKQDSIKQREREMKAEKEAEAERKKNVSRERKQMSEEKARLEIMAQKMSAKRLARKKRRLGITKKVSHA
ncbi:related to CGR1 - protein involved in processing of the pre-rRNA for the 60S ribosome subunit [Melanopsichium pennsylvanicum]|uniref:rRNA-processing protein n=2 Tax=Melanopsichium pennsylvanicum TaxID=63383 RepID=A0AAJ4XTL6_9BASI|nr:related to CGR1 - protein involved in processing of the pre-rRNA for the 60S ribosome subunit [Melanopsichium pennsylvanicum]